MGKKLFLRLSVHELVDFLLRKGDIDNRIYNDETMALGSKIHASYQKKQGNEYLSEVSLSETFVRELGSIKLEGRADGIILGEEYPIIDEIKSSVSPLSEFYRVQGEWHFGQAFCYALMYAHKSGAKKVAIRLTYISQIKDESMRKELLLSVEELESHVNSYIDRYLSFYDGIVTHKEKVKESAKELAFPYPSFREGQREMAKYVYSVCRDGGTFFCEAPTGIGKTMSALFPSIKSLSSSSSDRIFYLTAKSTGRESAYEAISLLREKGLYIRDSLLRAKDKMCFSPSKACNPDECPFAKGYYEKLREVMEKESQENNRFSISYVLALAKEKEMCPFELQLDLSLLSDIIICDFNYFFDPFVRLERYFGEESDSSKSIVLVDEAHNLIDRGRDMYSASISLSSLKKAEKELKGTSFKALKKSVVKLEKFLKEEEKGALEGEIVYESLPSSASSAISSFLEHKKDINKERSKDNAPSLGESFEDLSIELYRFSSLLSDYSENSLLYFSSKNEPTLHLFSLDPSAYLRSSLDKVKTRVLFSATLSPISFYMDSIYGEKAPYLLLPSPFPSENFSLLLAPMVSLRYKDRGKSMDEVVSYLKHFVDARVGNYFLFFPSYEYLESIKDKLVFKRAAKFVQERSMSEDERKIFLSEFKENPSISAVGLLTLSGAFSEGIDLIGDRLSGVAIVGIGIPTLSYERDKIREHFEKKEGKGFEYAYLDPGINHVMQATGRLIRSEKDKGVALLIDRRYLEKEYRSILSRKWKKYSVLTSPEDVEKEMRALFKEE